jgi:crotonobetainyl-CoA:carnitine CoA-transferase CaiB-like acyl-CoA transferase
VKLGRTPADPTRPAPAFGEHTEEVLRECGYSDGEIEEMFDSGAAAGPSADGATTFQA